MRLYICIYYYYYYANENVLSTGKLLRYNWYKTHTLLNYYIQIKKFAICNIYVCKIF